VSIPSITNRREVQSVKAKYIAAALCAVALNAPAWAETAKAPVKVSAADAAGPIFRNPKLAEKLADGKFTDVNLLSSTDKRFTAGMFQSGPVEEKIDAYPVDEFCYFLSGSVKLTSADGSVLELKAGDSVVIPKGWKGIWSTTGYTKYYTTYGLPPAAK